MTEMIRLVALTPLKVAGRRHEAGTVFDAAPVVAEAIVKAGFAEPVAGGAPAPADPGHAGLSSPDRLEVAADIRAAVEKAAEAGGDSVAQVRAAGDAVKARSSGHATGGA